MRTADRMLARQWSFPLGLTSPEAFMGWAVDAMKDAPVVVADNVAAYVAAHPPEMLESFPSVAPPWPTSWIEYPSSSGRQRRGVLVCDTTDLEADGSDDHIADLSSNARRHALLADGVDTDDVRWVVSLILFVEENRAVWGPAGMFSLALDVDGRVIGNRWSVSPVLTAGVELANSTGRTYQFSDPDVPTVDEIERMGMPERVALLERLRAKRDELESDRMAMERDLAGPDLTAAEFHASLQTLLGGTEHEWLLRALSPALQAIAFLHAKNVVLDTHTPPAKVQAKRRHHGKEPLTRWHTLRLEVPRRAGEHGGRNGSGSLLSAHIVSGHWSHFGSCCSWHPPKGLLFGKLTGKYWVQSHARGNPEVGRVRTDFDLKVGA